MVPSSAFGSWSVGQLELCTSGPQFSLCGSAHRTFWDFSSRNHGDSWKERKPQVHCPHPVMDLVCPH